MTTNDALSRVAIRDKLIERARYDSSCTAVALIGSAARGTEDEWSDIDLAVRLAPEADRYGVLGAWTTWLGSAIGTVDHFDIHAWDAVYRVFLCSNGLQIDLSFWPSDGFRARNGEPMVAVFGEVLEAESVAEPATDERWMSHARMGWLYALHARSAVRRGREFQADVMLSGWRERIVALASVRQGLTPDHARSAHLLPKELQDAVASTRPSDLSDTELEQALVRTGELYLAEVALHDAQYAGRLRKVVEILVR